jgi:hypothetical protein
MYDQVGVSEYQMGGVGADKRKTKVPCKSYHFIGQAVVGLAATAQSTQGVEHAWTEEADEGDHAQLDARRGIPAR